MTVLYWHTPTTTPEGGVDLYYEPDVDKFVLGVLEESDLDVCRMAIYDEHYYCKYNQSPMKKINHKNCCRSGGVNLLDSFFNEYIWHRLPPSPQLRRLKERIRKFVMRLNYGHFSQFEVPLEFLTRAQYQRIQSCERALPQPGGGVRPPQ